MTVAEALQALRNGELHLDADGPGPFADDPQAAAALRALTRQLDHVVGEVRRIANEIGSEGRFGGQIEASRLGGVWAELVVDVNHMARRVTDQIRDLHQTVAAQQRSEDRLATAPAAGEMKQLMDAVNAIRAQSRQLPPSEPLDVLAQDATEAAGRVQANLDTLASQAEARADEVRRLLAERTQFFAALSHEFRTPLAVILRQADLLEADAGGEVPAVMPAVGAIRSAGQDLLGAVNDVLDLAKAEASSLDLELAPVDVGELARELEQTARTLASAAELSFELSIAGGRHVVQGDARRLRQVLLNLIDNAVKYTPAGGSVFVEIAAGSSVVTCQVQDTGVGLDWSERKRIFEPFYRAPGTDAQRNQPSSGLGLALAKRILEAHGGRIWAIPGDPGSLFSFELPAAAG